MNGVDNLFNQTIVNRIRQAQDENNKVLVLVDADWPSKDGDMPKDIIVSKIKWQNYR